MSETKPRGLFRRIFTVRTLVLLLILIGLGAYAWVTVGPRLFMKGNFMPGIAVEQPQETLEELEKDRAAQQKEMAKAADRLIEGAPSWPTYRGADGDGDARDASGLIETWPAEGPPVLYRQPIGAGYAGFVIGGGRAFTIEQRGGEEVVTSYDFETGIELWAFDYGARFVERMGGDGPRATPTLDGERLYSLGAEGDLYCLSALDGEEIWHVNILRGRTNLQWGMSGAPLVEGDRVYVTNSGLGGDSIMAFDKMTGDEIWTSLPEQQGYATLIMADVAGRRQIVNFAAFNLNGIDPETGERLWSFEWTGSQNGINVSQPIPVGEDRIFISTGYGKGCAMVQINASDGDYTATELWSNLNMKNKFNPSVLRDGYIYGLDEGILACISAEDGSRQWKGGRYGHGQMLIAADQIYVLHENGKLSLVALDPTAHRELATFQAIEGKTWNVMAFAGGRLLIRNLREMACFDLRQQTPS